ncbi:MAG: histidine kinase [Ignavibacteria bacterium]|jgi:sensor histidine kinase YesM
MKNLAQLLFLLFVIFNNTKANEFNPDEQEFFRLQNLVIQRGDKFEYKDPGYDDSGWHELKNYEINEEPYGCWWIRTKITITESLTEHDGIISLQCMRLFSAYEIYWDGVLINNNGKVGTSVENEIPGSFRFPVFILPERTKKGVHTLAIRISNYHSNSNINAGKILFGNFIEWSKAAVSSLIRFYFILGILSITFLFNILLFFNTEKKLPNLLFALLCITVVSNVIINYYWLVSEVPTTYVVYQDFWNPISIVLLGILFPLYFIYEYNIPYKKIIIPALLFNLIFLMPGINYFERNYYLLISIIATSSLILIWAIKTKRKGSVVSLISLIIGTAIVYYNLDYDLEDLATISTIMIIGFDINLSREIAGREKAIKLAELKSARLEIELLKKNIRPHFIMNSLNTIMVLLRSDPSKAVKLVMALANEFRIVSQISELKLIPVSKEIEICRSHLDIINYRRGTRFELNLIDLAEDEEVPPMIFHTLIENGLTHGYGNKKTGIFELRREKKETGVKYSLFNDSTIKDKQNIKYGTGLKYVIARLEESFKNKYEFKAGPVKNGWETVITIMN